MRFLTSGFFQEPVFFQAPEYPIKAIFKFIRKITEIFAAQGSPPVSLTPVEMEKIFNQKSFNYFVWAPFGRRVNK
jgi:hypothetical protein